MRDREAFSVIAWTSAGGVRFLDQTALPDREVYREVRSVEDMVEAIRALRVRGAPLIGIAAAMGLAAAAADQVRRDALTPRWIEAALEALGAARPTAVNLRHAMERMRHVVRDAYGGGGDPASIVEALRAEADAIREEEAARCREIAAAGVRSVPDGARILTHCNTGALATGGIGTAMGVIRAAHEQGKNVSVVVCETRPLNQGARLTTWELTRLDVPCTAIVDAAAAALMAQGEIDLVLVGADRIAANGDVANKIGTYQLAVAARHHDLPFYVAAPRTTVDLAALSGAAIPVEVRAPAELVTAAGARVYNPAFDVTPAELVSAIITDAGVHEPPFGPRLAALSNPPPAMRRSP